MVPTLREQTVHLENNLNKMLPFVLLNLIIQQHGEVVSIKISRTQTGWETEGVSCPKSHTKSSPEMKLEPRLVTLRGGLVPRFSGTCSRKPQSPRPPTHTQPTPQRRTVRTHLVPQSHTRGFPSCLGRLVRQASVNTDASQFQWLDLRMNEKSQGEVGPREDSKWLSCARVHLSSND